MSELDSKLGKLHIKEDEFTGLSAQTLLALKEFAQGRGVMIDDEDDIVDSVREHFEDKERNETFKISYESKDGLRKISFDVNGIKRELGQTLNSTGLTIWRAAEHLCQYMIDTPSRFQNKSVCELGAGLGLVSILLDKLNVCSLLVSTDGDEDTMKLLIDNKIDTDCTFESSYLYWGLHQDFVSEYPNKFDTLVAADVIYEDEQIIPLLETVCALLKKDGEFILAFARRNVPVDKVLAEAEKRGLQYTILDDSYQGVKMEPIYSLTWKA